MVCVAFLIYLLLIFVIEKMEQEVEQRLKIEISQKLKTQHVIDDLARRHLAPESMATLTHSIHKHLHNFLLYISFSRQRSQSARKAETVRRESARAARIAPLSQGKQMAAISDECFLFVFFVFEVEFRSFVVDLPDELAQLDQASSQPNVQRRLLHAASEPRSHTATTTTTTTTK